MPPPARLEAAFLGLALGDALGAPAEFLPREAILARWPPAGPQAPEGDPILVTDDTQMAIAVAEALLDARAGEELAEALRRRFVAWWRSPENDRAPGQTCLQACEALARGGPWQAASVPGSKGCGATMRVAAVAALPAAARGPAAQLQAALTHGHPTALAAAELTAEALARLLSAPATPLEALVSELREHALSQREVWHPVLGELWQRPGLRAPEAFIARGWDEVLSALDRLERALAVARPEDDPAAHTGEGWLAEASLMTALLSWGLSPTEPLAVIRRAAASGGDSDSLAALAGAFAGASAASAGAGAGAWPEEWLARLEHRERLEALAAALAG